MCSRIVKYCRFFTCASNDIPVAYISDLSVFCGLQFRLQNVLYLLRFTLRLINFFHDCKNNPNNFSNHTPCSVGGLS